MVQLAADSPEASTTKQIAEKTKVPGAYLAKVLQSMRRAGLIHSRRGVGGGVALAHEPKSISLLEVIDAVEPLQRAGGKSRSSPTPLQRTLDSALGEVRKHFEARSLADMLPRKRAKSGAKKRKGRAARKRASAS
jgi:Rrf2 family protein